MNLHLKKILLLAGTALLLATGGCFDTTEDFTINPDGSGKVVHECTFQAMSLGNDSQDPAQALTNAVREVLEHSEGVDTWANVTFKTLDDGRLYFKGTAYFKDLSKLDINNQTMLEFDWAKAADGTAILNLRTNKSPTPDGVTIKKAKPEAKNLSPEEFTKKLKQDRMKFQQSKPMLAGFLGPMKHTVVLHLPGKVASSSNFAKDANGNLTLKFEGAKLIEVMDKLVNDDAWCQKHQGTGFDDMEEKPMMDEEINQMIFGEKAPVRATIAASAAPLFNYTAETAAARKEFAQTKKALGSGSSSSAEAEPEVVAAAPSSGGVKSVKVAGVRLVRASEGKDGLRAFNWDASYTVVLLVEFPGAVQSITDKSALEVATTDDGTSLLPESDWDRRLHFPNLGKDKTTAMMELKMNLPAENVKGLKELSGHIQYRVSSGTKEVDLGLESLKTGATGTELDAKIESIKEGWQKNGSQNLSLHLKGTPEDFKSISLVVDGTKTELNRNGYSSSGGSCDLTLESKVTIPEKGKLVAEIYDKVQVYTAPFKLENISLLGGKMDAAK